MNTFIYALIDPRTNEIRYVGKSNMPNIRYKAHIRNRKQNNTHKNNWINSVFNSNMVPILQILEECNISEWEQREKYHISIYPNLTNLTSGGVGIPNYKFTRTQLKNKIVKINGKNNHFYGKHHTEKTKKLLSYYSKKYNKEYGNPFLGKTHTEETKNIISKSTKNTWAKGNGVLPPVMCGKDNPAAKKRILIDPNNNIFEVYSFKKFCDEHYLSYSTLKNNINKGVINEPQDPLIKSRQRKKSLNTIGWEIKM